MTITRKEHLFSVDRDSTTIISSFLSDAEKGQRAFTCREEYLQWKIQSDLKWAPLAASLGLNISEAKTLLYYLNRCDREILAEETSKHPDEDLVSLFAKMNKEEIFSLIPQGELTPRLIETCKRFPPVAELAIRREQLRNLLPPQEKQIPSRLSRILGMILGSYLGLLTKLMETQEEWVRVEKRATEICFNTIIKASNWAGDSALKQTFLILTTPLTFSLMGFGYIMSLAGINLFYFAKSCVSIIGGFIMGAWHGLYCGHKNLSHLRQAEKVYVRPRLSLASIADGYRRELAAQRRAPLRTVPVEGVEPSPAPAEQRGLTLDAIASIEENDGTKEPTTTELVRSISTTADAGDSNLGEEEGRENNLSKEPTSSMDDIDDTPEQQKMFARYR